MKRAGSPANCKPVFLLSHDDAFCSTLSPQRSGQSGRFVHQRRSLEPGWMRALAF
ncbi:hypothetical protein [Ottowia sp.]|uniref:hypothetical protein n=1 Tax=Ottowia sp. TaxID=1898956 RepID=UPI003A8A49BF